MAHDTASIRDFPAIVTWILQLFTIFEVIFFKVLNLLIQKIAF